MPVAGRAAYRPGSYEQWLLKEKGEPPVGYRLYRYGQTQDQETWIIKHRYYWVEEGRVITRLLDYSELLPSNYLFYKKRNDNQVYMEDARTGEIVFPEQPKPEPEPVEPVVVPEPEPQIEILPAPVQVENNVPVIVEEPEPVESTMEPMEEPVQTVIEAPVTQIPVPDEKIDLHEEIKVEQGAKPIQTATDDFQNYQEIEKHFVEFDAQKAQEQQQKAKVPTGLLVGGAAALLLFLRRK